MQAEMAPSFLQSRKWLQKARASWVLSRSCELSGRVGAARPGTPSGSSAHLLIKFGRVRWSCWGPCASLGMWELWAGSSAATQGLCCAGEDCQPGPGVLRAPSCLVSVSGGWVVEACPRGSQSSGRDPEESGPGCEALLVPEHGGSTEGRGDLGASGA